MRGAATGSPTSVARPSRHVRKRDSISERCSASPAGGIDTSGEGKIRPATPTVRCATRNFSFRRDSILNKRSADILISKDEYTKRMEALKQQGGFKIPENQTPWQEMQRGMVDELSRGMVLKPAVKYQRIAQSKGVPRDNH